VQDALQGVGHWITAAIAYAGYPGLVALMAMESACLPIPSEVIMPFAGYLASVGRFNLWLAATFGAIGCNIGSAIAYEIGARGGRPFLRRWGRYLLLNQHDLDRVDRLFARYGAISVLVGRLLPILRTFIALPAGIAHMNRAAFHLYTFIGSWPWCFLLAWVGYQLGVRWSSDPALHAVMHDLDLAIAGVLVLAAGYFVFTRIRSLSRPLD
jgi:membrane protein DedA with SNARE-associated domain